MAEYLTNEAAIKATADAIRKKTGKSATISWNKDKGFANEISSVPSGATKPYTEETLDGSGSVASAKLYGYVNVRKALYKEATTLKTVTLNECGSLKDDVFNGCTALTTVTFENGSSPLEIGARCFSGCRALNSITLPNSIKTIKESAFYGCDGMAMFGSLELSNSLESIGKQAFYGTQMGTVTIPASVKTIEDGAFSSMAFLSQVTFQGTPTTISSTAFSNCSGLSTVNVPWAQDAVANAPWGATSATINYNYKG